MSTATVLGFDATHENLGKVPTNAGQAAGYSTGTGTKIPWTQSDWQKYPDAVRIDQSPVNTFLDEQSDFIDFENGAATLADLAIWVKNAHVNFMNNVRPGQRWAGVYCSRDNVTPVVNALIAGGITSCPLGVAQYNFDLAQAQQEVANSAGPFPIVWRQYSDRGGNGAYDLDVWSVPWLEHRSGHQPITPTIPPGQWNDAHHWAWKSAFVGGVGLDGNVYGFRFNPVNGLWEGPLRLA